ncbi:MAG: hypothetical protein EOM37_07215 [Proteobacteria bacterium]|jgi:hypothetical protein|nr:hypothetical protein [Alphaproteobacteria bacterium]NCC03819.1 hypothetical protein [Pseudomonadota bacterium]
MKRFGHFLLILIAILSVGAPAQARHGKQWSNDMFYDRQWIYDRPVVPSDRYRGQDMFKTYPPMQSGHPDMLHRVETSNTFGREDMFPHRGRIRQVPIHTLKIDP